MFDGLTLPAGPGGLVGRRELDPLHAINRGLRGWWPLDEAGGTFVRDISPYRRTAVLTLGGVARFTGARGWATKFTSNGYFAVSNFAWPASSAITVSFWAAPQVNSFNGAFEIGSGASAGCWLNYGSDLYWDYPESGGRISVARASASAWTLVTLVASPDGFRGIYFNGVLAASTTSGGAGPSAQTGLCIGRYLSGGASVNDGFKNFRVLQRRLRDSEIRALYSDPWIGSYVDTARIFMPALVVSASATPATADPGAGAIAIAGQAVAATAGATASPGGGSVALAGRAVGATAGATAAPGAGAVALAGRAVAATAGATASPGAAQVSLAGRAATATAGATASPGAGAMVWRGWQVQIASGLPAEWIPQLAGRRLLRPGGTRIVRASAPRTVLRPGAGVVVRPPGES